MVTINPARLLQIDDRKGSLEVFVKGKNVYQKEEII